jgi:hypothetical protein
MGVLRRSGGRVAARVGDVVYDGRRARRDDGRAEGRTRRFADGVRRGRPRRGALSASGRGLHVFGDGATLSARRASERRTSSRFARADGGVFVRAERRGTRRRRKGAAPRDRPFLRGARVPRLRASKADPARIVVRERRVFLSLRPLLRGAADRDAAEVRTRRGVRRVDSARRQDAREGRRHVGFLHLESHEAVRTPDLDATTTAARAESARRRRQAPKTASSTRATYAFKSNFLPVLASVMQRTVPKTGRAGPHGRSCTPPIAHAMPV